MEHVSGRDVTTGDEAPEGALDEDAPKPPAPSGAEITAGEAAPEAAATDTPPDPETTAG